MVEQKSTGYTFASTDYSITEEMNGKDVLTLTIISSSEDAQHILPDDILVENTYSEAEYVIKKINGDDDDVEITAELNLDDFKSEIYKAFNKTGNPYNILNEVVPGGWVVDDRSGITSSKTVELDAPTAIDVADSVINIFGVAIRYDFTNHHQIIYDPKSFKSSGQYATKELNVSALYRYQDSTNLINRLYAYGKDDLSFADINDGKPYVEDTSYLSGRIRCGYIQDDRFTDAQSLLEYAQDQIATLAHPTSSYDCTIADIGATNTKYAFLKLELLSVVTLLDVDANVRADHQVVQRIVHPYNPEYNSLTLSSMMPSFSGQVISTEDQIKNETAGIVGQIEGVIGELTEEILTASAGHIVINYGDDGKMAEILIMDTDDKATATNVIRMNQNGIAFSTSGYNGPFNGILGLDGTWFATFLNTWQLNAETIVSGILQSQDGTTFYLDLENGILNMEATSLTIKGSQVVTEDQAIESVDVQYASGTSNTTPPTSGWSTDSPQWQSGRYIWQRTVTTMADGTQSISDPTCIQGAQGPAGQDGADGLPGKDGIDGTSQYVHIKYSSYSNPQYSYEISDTPNKYIGICVDENPTDPVDPSYYTWSQWQGEDGAQGLPGSNGEDGRTTYVHFAYSTTSNGSGNFSTTPFDDAKYVGVCTDFNVNDPTTYYSYQWSPMRGKGVSSIQEQYYLSTSSSYLSGGSWSTNQPAWQSGRYIWTRSRITWDDNTTTYTTAILANGLNSANQNASDAQDAVNDLDESLNQQGVFNRLTNNGQTQGIYLSGGRLYLNATYMQTGTLNANLIKTGVINSNSGHTQYDLDKGTIRMGSSNGNRVNINDRGINWYVQNGSTSYLTGVLYSVFGETWIGANSRYVNYGWVNSATPNSYRGMRVDNTGSRVSFNTSHVDVESGDLGVSGGISTRDLNAWGNKHRIVRTSLGNLAFSAMESPEPAFCDWGGGTIGKDGTCPIVLTPEYRIAIAQHQALRWMLTPINGAANLWLERTDYGALVHGNVGDQFDWLCIGVQFDMVGTYAPLSESSPPPEADEAIEVAHGFSVAAEKEEVEMLIKVMEDAP